MKLLKRLLNFLLRLNPDCTSCPSRLCELKVGKCARVTALDLPMEHAHRLLEMGMTTGTWLRVVRLAPLGDPIEINVRGYHLSLRSQDAAGIRIALEPDS